VHSSVTPARKEGFVRRNPALLSSAAIAIVAAASLTGCTADAVDPCSPLVARGESASLVTASGPVGSLPKVDFLTLTVDAPQRAVLEAGDGPVAQKGMTVDFDAAVFDAASGRQLITTNFDGSPGVRYRAGSIPSGADAAGALANALVCAQPGERIALVSSSADSGLDLSSLGIAPDAEIVFILDVQSVFLGKADGINQLPLDGMPTVVTAPDGTVGITVPAAEAPTETRISTIKAGSGEKVEDGDDVVLQIASWIWPAVGQKPVKLQSTWTGVPLTAPMSVDPTGATGLTQGFYDAVIGASVGSQILAVVAPADSYAPGAWPAGAGEGSTIIYVIDVVGIQNQAE
jgi:peptidylprolyl isomerase